MNAPTPSPVAPVVAAGDDAAAAAAAAAAAVDEAKKKGATKGDVDEAKDAIK